MNENLNLIEILKNCPKGTKLYSPLYGEVKFGYIDFAFKEYPIVIERNDVYIRFTQNGRLDYFINEQECMLFPSKENRDWVNFKPKKQKFDPKTLQVFDKVLARVNERPGMWYADFISINSDALNPIPCVMGDKDFDVVIPYNDDTKHLVGTMDEAPEYYKYWDD